MSEAHWYVVHTYSGYENKVKVDIEKTIENRNLQDQILEVSVPMLPVVELKNGVEKKADKKMFPGYVLINMVMNDDTWYVVRNTRGVTGFVGPGSKPVPLTEEEMETVRQHPLVGAEMTKKFPKGLTIDKLNALSYEICRHHHERYDGAGYPDGLHGEEIPLCAQVVGLADAYDALISPRPYKSKLTHGEALQMILNGECGSFSQPLLHCFLEAAMQKEWIKKADS